MKKFKTNICWILFFLLAIPCSLAWGTRPEVLDSGVSPFVPGNSAGASAREFVQAFYDWYVPTVRKERGMSGDKLVLKYKRSLFSPELLRALKIDSDAQARSPHKLVGLDFDPFISAQEYADGCVAEKVMQKGDRYFVEVHDIWSGSKSADPDVVAELALKDGHWFFVNFHYGNSAPSLLSVLKSLRERRRRHHGDPYG
jgi:hypothetical protein